MTSHHPSLAKAVHPLHGAFGSDAFGRRAEAFARFFGTPRFLIGQTAVVGLWIALNGAALAFRWDPYPFILLNLAFSLQAAYAAPLILLAQTRQADRDKMMSDADAQHREQLATAMRAQQAAQNAELRDLIDRNMVLSEEIQRLAGEIQGSLARRGG